ncbi:precorrin-3B C(17)-methyltransferase [Paenibacillus polymyxa]|uniref:precorrin-3B C(17)-methyltransferase n=1 Tax=Paenibacillus polymyxa TaxID=1406 RepID=UPI00287FA699|nr:precorrin-3B C(17)-methyltransferase [Paenibacillus polymyxa]
MSPLGKLLVIGFGPGDMEHITKRALDALAESEVIIGYNTYVDLIRPLLNGQEIVRTGMTEEVSRAQEAVRQAEMGKKVAVISSGDAGVYGMAGLVYEVLMQKGWRREDGVEVEVVPGISAIQSCASLLGAPVMHDACTISLSDHLTPWETIVKRVEAAASADFVIALYNPRSGRRTRQIVETQSILLRYRDPQTPVGLVKSAYRERQQVIVTTLEDMLNHDIGMLTTVIIGNSSTTVYDGLIVTPRGYQRKYTLDATEQALKPHQRLRTEAEPWSLDASQAGAAPAVTGPSASGAAVATQARPQAMATVQATTAVQTGAAPASLAAEALSRLAVGGKLPGAANARWNGQASAAESTARMSAVAGAGASTVMATGGFGKPALFEVGVSPGVGNKKFTARQMALLAEVAGDDGELEYTPDHQIVLRVPCADPEELVGRLRDERFIVMPIGDVFKVKACDFCNMEKDDAVPVAEHLQVVLGGLQAPKETSIALNGCGMACYGAVLEDIGIVYRKGGYDLFLGGKKFGRNAHAAQPVAEGIPGDQITDIVENVIAEYKEKGHPNERFHKFFKRVGVVAGFRHEDAPATVEVNAVCGD